MGTELRKGALKLLATLTKDLVFSIWNFRVQKNAGHLSFEVWYGKPWLEARHRPYMIQKILLKMDHRPKHNMQNYKKF